MQNRKPGKGENFGGGSSLYFSNQVLLFFVIRCFHYFCFHQPAPRVNGLFLSHSLLKHLAKCGLLLGSGYTSLRIGYGWLWSWGWSRHR